MLRVALRAILLAGFSVAFAPFTQAQTQLPQGAVEVPETATYSRPADIQINSMEVMQPTKARGLLHSFQLDLDVGNSSSKSKDRAHPDKRSTDFGTTSLRFGVADRGYGAVGFSRSSNEVDSAGSSGDRTHTEIDTNSLSAGGGYWVIPRLALGGVVGYDRGNGGLAYPPAGPNETHTRAYQWGPYATVRLTPDMQVPLDWTTTYLMGRSRQTFTANSPDHDNGRTQSWVNTLSGSYPIGDFRLRGAVSWTHVASQHNGDPAFLAGAAPPPGDRNWYTLSAGVGYRISDNWEARVGGATWLGNSQTRFQQLTVGVSTSL
ncbi:MAG: hypothetical protein ACM30I_13625 [Gemmatimonas sp.]